MSELVTPDPSGPVTVARVAGEIDLANAHRVRDELLALADDDDGLVVDLAEVPYLDSSGVSVFFQLARILDERGQLLVVTVPAASPLCGLLRITALHEFAPLCNDLGAAFELIVQRRRQHREVAIDGPFDRARDGIPEPPWSLTPDDG